RVPRLARRFVLLAAQEPDHVEGRDAPLHGHAAQRVHGGVEAGVLDHEHHGLAADVEPARDGGGLVLGGAGEDADLLLLVEGGEHRLLVRVGHAQDPAEMRVLRRLGHLRDELLARLAKSVLERVDDERCGNGLWHDASWAVKCAYPSITLQGRSARARAAGQPLEGGGAEAGAGGGAGGGGGVVGGSLGGARLKDCSSSGVVLRIRSVTRGASTAVPTTRGVMRRRSSVFSIFSSVDPKR